MSLKELNSHLFEVLNADSCLKIPLGRIVKELLLEQEYFVPKKDNSYDFFSERELKILYQVCLECTNQEIADKLQLSIRTVESHRRRMIERTQSKTMLGVVLFAMTNNLELQAPQQVTKARLISA